MSWVATGIVATGLASSYMNGQAAKSAAQTQADAANHATQVAGDQYEQTRADQAPWRQTGSDALTRLNNDQGYYNQDFTMAQFQKDPGYQFRMDEGNKAIERSAAARGGLDSGATMKALTRYGQGVASDEYNNAYNRFQQDRTGKFNREASLAGLGQTATNQTDAAGTNYANQAGQNIMAAGNASAAGTVGQANATTNGLNTGINTWMNYEMMNRYAPNQPTGPSGGAGAEYDDFYG